MEQVQVFFQKISKNGSLDQASEGLTDKVNRWLEEHKEIELISRQTCVSGDTFCLSLFYKMK